MQDIQIKADRVIQKYEQAHRFQAAKEEKARMRAAEEQHLMWQMRGRVYDGQSDDDGVQTGYSSGKETPRTANSRPVPSSSEHFAAVNSRDKKDYVLRCDELTATKNRMQVQKKFKGLAEEATKIDEANDDPITRKLRNLHNKYTERDKKAKEGTPRGMMRNESCRSELSQTAGHRGKCGLCERDFPPEAFVGHAWKRQLQKLRRRREREVTAEDGNNQATEHHGRDDRFTSRHSDTTVVDKEQMAQLSEGPGGASGQHKAQAPLYDYSVQLCSACHMYVSASMH